MIVPSAHQAIKTAGLSEVGTAAALGALISGVASRIPMLASLRITHPTLYDAAIVAGTVQLMETVHETEVLHDGSMVPMMPAV